MGIHARKDKRCICTECHKTFVATTGAALYRLQTAAETVTLVVTRMAHGCPLHAIVAAFGFDERTVARWLTRAGVQGQAVQAPLVERPRDLGQVQADPLGGDLQFAPLRLVYDIALFGFPATTGHQRTATRATPGTASVSSSRTKSPSTAYRSLFQPVVVEPSPPHWTRRTVVIKHFAPRGASP